MPKERRNLIYPYPRIDEDVVLSMAAPTIDGLVLEPDPIVYDFRVADISTLAPEAWSIRILSSQLRAHPSDGKRGAGELSHVQVANRAIERRLIARVRAF